MGEMLPESVLRSAATCADQNRALRADLADLFKWFQKEYFGRGPNDVRVELFGKAALVISTGVLAGHERRLVETMKDGSGQRLIREVRDALFEIGRPLIQAKLGELFLASDVDVLHQLFPEREETIFLVRYESLAKAVPPFERTKDHGRRCEDRADSSGSH